MVYAKVVQRLQNECKYIFFYSVDIEYHIRNNIIDLSVDLYQKVHIEWTRNV